MAAEYTGIFPSSKNIGNYFVELIEENNCENIKLFLANLEKNLLANKLFDSNTDNALNYACLNEFYDSALCLINTGNANIDEKNAEGYTPLMFCARSSDRKSLEVAEALLSRGCKAEEVNNDGRTALVRCCRYRTSPSLKLGITLLDTNRGDYPSLLDKDGFGGLDYLLDFDEEARDRGDYAVGYYVLDPQYIEFVAKYLKFYLDSEKIADEVYLRNIQKICDIEVLKKALRPVFNKTTGISFDEVCKPIKDAGVGVPIMGQRVEGLELPGDLSEASELDVAVAQREEGVSPGGRFVPSYRYDEVGTLPKPNFPEQRPPPPLGGEKKRTKKRMPKIKRRKTRKIRKSRK